MKKIRLLNARALAIVLSAGMAVSGTPFSVMAAGVTAEQTAEVGTEDPEETAEEEAPTEEVAEEKVSEEGSSEEAPEEVPEETAGETIEEKPEESSADVPADEATVEESKPAEETVAETEKEEAVSEKPETSTEASTESPKEEYTEDAIKDTTVEETKESAAAVDGLLQNDLVQEIVASELAEKKTKTYDEVVELFKALPDASEITEEMTGEEKQQIFDELLAPAMEAYDVLTEEEQAKFEEEHGNLLKAALRLNDAITGNVPETYITYTEFNLEVGTQYSDKVLIAPITGCNKITIMNDYITTLNSYGLSITQHSTRACLKNIYICSF